MPLTPGTKLGPYEILSPLGAGGMGEVYRARDTRLNREVAVKILPEDFAQDAERLARFEREALALAAVNHPHIAAIYGVEESSGVRALVMELVQGETLARIDWRKRRRRSFTRRPARGRDISKAASTSPGRSQRRSKRRTRRGSCIATSSPRTSRCRPPAR